MAGEAVKKGEIGDIKKLVNETIEEGAVKETPDVIVKSNKVWIEHWNLFYFPKYCYNLRILSKKYF